MWNGGRDPKRDPMGGDCLYDGDVELFVHFILEDYVHLNRIDHRTWATSDVKVPIQQWRDEVRRSSVLVISKFL